MIFNHQHLKSEFLSTKDIVPITPDNPLIVFIKKGDQYFFNTSIKKIMELSQIPYEVK